MVLDFDAHTRAMIFFAPTFVHDVPLSLWTLLANSGREPELKHARNGVRLCLPAGQARCSRSSGAHSTL